MPFDFRQSAIRKTTVSPLMENRTKLTTDDLIRKYPQGVSVIEFDLVTTTDAEGNPDTYPVFLIAEDPNVFCNGGKVVQSIFEGWVEAYDGDITGASEGLRAFGGVKMLLTKSRTKNSNRTVTAVRIL